MSIFRHTGQRDYKCGVCDFLGYTFTDIRKHIERKHSDPKTIICNKCGQAFKTEQLLKVHILTFLILSFKKMSLKYIFFPPPPQQEHKVSDQCELFMLEQVLLENEQMSETLHVEDPHIDDAGTDNLIETAAGKGLVNLKFILHF